MINKQRMIIKGAQGFEGNEHGAIKEIEGGGVGGGNLGKSVREGLGEGGTEAKTKKKGRLWETGHP